MAKEERASVLVRMSPKLKDKIARDAFNRGSNLTSVIVGLLAEHYGVRYSPSNRRSVPFGGGHLDREEKRTASRQARSSD